MENKNLNNYWLIQAQVKMVTAIEEASKRLTAARIRYLIGVFKERLVEVGSDPDQ